MEKYLYVETADNLELVPIDEEELDAITPVIAEIANVAYSAGSNGHATDHGRYGHMEGYEVFTQFIPDGGIRTIKVIKVVNVIKTLLA